MINDRGVGQRVSEAEKAGSQAGRKDRVREHRSSRRSWASSGCLGRVTTFQGGKQTRVRVAKLMKTVTMRNRGLESIGKQRVQLRSV